MKKDIHPKYFPNAKTICSCGNILIAGSTLEEIHTEICSACHPFFTGKMKFIDTAGRVEKFKARQEKAAKLKSAQKKEEQGEAESA